MQWKLYYEEGAWFGVADDDDYHYETFSQPSPERVGMAIDIGDYYPEAKSIGEEPL